MAELNEEQIERYSRQLMLTGWGSREQLQLSASHVAVSASLEAAALYLAGAGVGRVSIINTDDDELVKKLTALNANVVLAQSTEDQLPPIAALLSADEDIKLNAAQIFRSGSGLSEQARAAAELILALVKS